MTGQSAYRSLPQSVLLALLILLNACGNSDKTVYEYTRRVVMTEEAKDVVSYLSQDGEIRAKLTAPLMIRTNGDTISVEFPQTLHCDFFDDSTRQKESWLDSRYGIYYENLNKVYLRDSVVVISVNGDTLRTPDLWWDQNNKLFYTDKFARYNGPNKILRGGVGMEATQDLRRITFKDATGNLKVSDNGMPD